MQCGHPHQPVVGGRQVGNDRLVVVPLKIVDHGGPAPGGNVGVHEVLASIGQIRSVQGVWDDSLLQAKKAWNYDNSQTNPLRNYLKLILDFTHGSCPLNISSYLIITKST